MTLGRTSGAIKIKTDGGLRAVNCACCNPCGGDIIMYVDGTAITVPPPDENAEGTASFLRIGTYCSGGYFTFIDNVNCDGDVIYTYETELCRGTSITYSFACTPLGIRSINLEKELVSTSLSSFDCNVCVEGDLPQGPCREETEYQNYDDYFQFGTDYIVNTTTNFYSLSVCGCGDSYAPDPVPSTMTLRFELA